ncbi:hypothetical protein SAXI111661_14700 [Saccharomonospora xinjiangensis]|nr:hypothetical protein EYD13_17155 [Saccharomonospora xinjiangensis]
MRQKFRASEPIQGSGTGDIDCSPPLRPGRSLALHGSPRDAAATAPTARDAGKTGTVTVRGETRGATDAPIPVRSSTPVSISYRRRNRQPLTSLCVTLGCLISGQRRPPFSSSPTTRVGDKCRSLRWLCAAVPRERPDADVSVSTAVTTTPWAARTRVQASAVAPVVITSSSRTTGVSGRGAPAGSKRTRPSRFATRAARLSPTASLALAESRRAGATAAASPLSASEAAHHRASARTCEPPLARAADGRDGTGTNHQVPSSAGLARGNLGTAAARARPSGRARSRRPRSLLASTSSRGMPSCVASAVIPCRTGTSPEVNSARQPSQAEAPMSPHPAQTGGSNRSATAAPTAPAKPERLPSRAEDRVRRSRRITGTVARASDNVPVRRAIRLRSVRERFSRGKTARHLRRSDRAAPRPHRSRPPSTARSGRRRRWAVPAPP